MIDMEVELGVQLEIMDQIAEEMLENPEKISAQIHALRSFYGHESSATFLKSSLENPTLMSLSRIKYGMQQYLEHGSQPSLTSNTSQKSGNGIVQTNDSWEYHLQE